MAWSTETEQVIENLLDYSVSGMSQIQMESFVVGSESRGTAWGAYHQASREVIQRLDTLKDTKLKIQECEAQILIRKEELCKAMSVGKEALLNTKIEKQEVEKAKAEREQIRLEAEIEIFAPIVLNAYKAMEAWAETNNRPLDKDAFNQLESEFWTINFGQKLAHQTLTGSVSNSLLELIVSLPLHVQRDIQAVAKKHQKLLTADNTLLIRGG